MKAKSRLLVAHGPCDHMVQTMDDNLADLLFYFLSHSHRQNKVHLYNRHM
jgi:hypothetical protein